MSRLLRAVSLAATLTALVSAFEYEHSEFDHITSTYKLHTTWRSWSSAERSCQREGAHLVVIDETDEATTVGAIYSRLPTVLNGDYIWVGIHDLIDEGDWLTVMGDSVYSSDYNWWARGEPNNYRGHEDCGVVNRGIQYNDMKCTRQFPYICEREGRFPKW